MYTSVNSLNTISNFYSSIGIYDIIISILSIYEIDIHELNTDTTRKL